MHRSLVALRQTALDFEAPSPSPTVPRFVPRLVPTSPPPLPRQRPEWSPGALLARVRAMREVPDELVVLLRRALAESEASPPSTRRDLQREELQLALHESLSRAPVSAICAVTPTNVSFVAPSASPIPREHPDDLEPWDFEMELD